MGLPPRLLVGSLVGAVAVAAVLTGCVGGSENGEEDLTDPAAAVAAAGPVATADVVAGLSADSGTAADSGADPAAEDGTDSDEPAELGPIDPLDIPGEIISEYNLVDGDCFNRFEGLQAGRRLAITARIGCDEPHWAEVYHVFELDAPYPAVYPGDDAVRGFARRVCYEHFEAFVGEAYELSVYEIGVFTPNRTNFEHEVARYRGVHCWLYRVEDEPLSGTAEGTAI